MQGISHACFGLSYCIAFVLEILGTRHSTRGLRWAGLLAGAAGLLAHTLYLFTHTLTAADPSASLLLVAWVLAVFYFYGTIHHAKQAWAIFVLPVILGLVGLSWLVVNQRVNTSELPPWLTGQRFWGSVHGMLLLLASVGVAVGFLASVMYLLQARRLRRKQDPKKGLNLLSLEKLEQMNRRSLAFAFPMLTAGLVLGLFLLYQDYDIVTNWLSVKILGTAGLWLVFLVLLYLRYAVNVPARRLAILSIFAFALMVTVLTASHPIAMLTPGQPTAEGQP